MRWADRLFDAAGWLAGAFLVGTLAMVLISIVGRLWPPLALPGADAYAGYCMAAAAFLALPVTLRRGEHIRVQLLLQRLPVPARRALDLLAHAVGVLLASLLAWYAARLVWQSHLYHDLSTGLDATPLWIPQLGMALGSALFALALLLQTLERLRGVSGPTTTDAARVE